MLMLGAATPKSRAMVGRAVARMVASSCSMNIALATIRAMKRKLSGFDTGAETSVMGSTVDDRGPVRVPHADCGQSLSIFENHEVRQALRVVIGP